MRKQLLEKPLISCKTAVYIIAALLVLLFPAVTNAGCVTATVTFGNPQSSGGFCTGKGVCKTASTSDASAVNNVTVTFVVNATNPGVLVMRFSMSDLMSKQPEQVAYFTDPGGYYFDSKFTLSDPMFAPLNLLPNAKVMPGISYSTSVTGDMVSMYIPYSHDGG